MPDYEYEAMDRFGVSAPPSKPPTGPRPSRSCSTTGSRRVPWRRSAANPGPSTESPVVPRHRHRHRPSDASYTDPPDVAPRELDGFGWTYDFSSMRAKFGLPLLLVGVAAITVSWRFLPAAIFGLFFAAIGLRILQVARTEARSRLQAWRHGTTVRGRVTSVGSDTSIRINGRPAFPVEYEFDTGGETHRGRRSTFNPAITVYAPDDAIWVVHDPDDPQVNAIWPPIR